MWVERSGLGTNPNFRRLRALHLYLRLLMSRLSVESSFDVSAFSNSFASFVWERWKRCRWLRLSFGRLVRRISPEVASDPSPVWMGEREVWEWRTLDSKLRIRRQLSIFRFSLRPWCCWCCRPLIFLMLRVSVLDCSYPLVVFRSALIDVEPIEVVDEST